MSGWTTPRQWVSLAKVTVNREAVEHVDRAILLAHLRTKPSFDAWGPPDLIGFGYCPECGRGLRKHLTWDAEAEHAEMAIGCPHEDRPAMEGP